MCTVTDIVPEQSSTSIVFPILESASIPANMSEITHKLALEYLSIHLSIRDRAEIVRVLCRSSPDHLTTLVRSITTAYEPVIRNFHKAVDLPSTVSDVESFIGDFIKLAKLPPPEKDGKVAKQSVPSVGDFVQLLKKHQGSFHKFLHQMCKNGTELLSWYVPWARKAAFQFRRDGAPSESVPEGAGKLNEPLKEMFRNLPAEQREAIVPILDAQARYLHKLQSVSDKRLEAALKSPPSQNPVLQKILASSNSISSSRDQSPGPGVQIEPVSDRGPGAYLDRWESLLASTELTPQTLNTRKLKTPDTSSDSKPDPRIVIKSMGQKFRDLMGEKGLYW